MPEPFLIKKRDWHRSFPVNFEKFLRTPFLIEHLWWMLLNRYELKGKNASSYWRVFLAFLKREPTRYYFQKALLKILKTTLHIIASYESYKSTNSRITLRIFVVCSVLELKAAYFLIGFKTFGSYYSSWAFSLL